MRICGAARAFPKNHYSQDVIRKALKSRWFDKLERPQVDHLHSSVGVKGRYLVLPSAAYEDLSTWSEANDAWIHAAQPGFCSELILLEW
jgi:predicted naringenin-chalcone synthase